MCIDKPTSILILIAVIVIILGAILPGLGKHKDISRPAKKHITSEIEKIPMVDGNALAVAENTATYDEVWGPVKMITRDNLKPFSGKKIAAFLYGGHEFHHDSTCAACKGESVEK